MSGLTATLALLEKRRRIPRVWRTKLEGQLICKGCIPNGAVSTPRRNPRPDGPPLHVVHTGPKVVSYPWLQSRNRGWFWGMLLGVLFGSLYSLVRQLVVQIANLIWVEHCQDRGSCARSAVVKTVAFEWGEAWSSTGLAQSASSFSTSLTLVLTGYRLPGFLRSVQLQSVGLAENI